MTETSIHLNIRSFEPSDEAAVIDLWHRCGLVVPWNDPKTDIAQKLDFQPELLLVGTLNSSVIATVMAGLMIGNFGLRLSMEKKARKTVLTFFESIDFIINSILFILIGLELQAVIRDGGDFLTNLRPLWIGIIALLVSRAVAVYPLYRLLNLSYFDKQAVEDLRANRASRQLDRNTMPARWWEPPPIPERFVRLAFSAYQAGNISRTKLAEYLNVSLLDLTDTLLEYGLDDRENYKAKMLTSRR